MSLFKPHYTPTIVLHMFSLIMVAVITYVLQNHTISLTMAYSYYAILLLILMVRAGVKIMKPVKRPAGYVPPKEEPFFNVVFMVGVVSSSLLAYLGYVSNTVQHFQIYMGYYINPIIMITLICVMYKLNHYSEYKNAV